jgi:hypothetical protein
MDSWRSTSPEITSFANLYARSRPLHPTLVATSYNTKATTPAENLSFQSLRSLHHLDPNELTLGSHNPPHNLQWATDVLHNHGPNQGNHPLARLVWNPDDMMSIIPSEIASEQDVKEYMKWVVIHGAVAGAICLYEHHEQLRPSCYPPGKWEVADLSTVGGSGRADLTLRTTTTPKTPVAGFEFKTNRVGSSQSVFQRSVSVLRSVTNWIVPGITINVSQMNLTEQWQKKFLKFLTQASPCSF